MVWQSGAGIFTALYVWFPPLICIPLPSPIWSMPESQLEIFSGLSACSTECCWVAELEQQTNLETCCSGSFQSVLTSCLGCCDISSLTSHWLDMSGGCRSCSLVRVIAFVLVGCGGGGDTQKQPCIFRPPRLTSCTVVTFYAPKLASGFPQESLVKNWRFSWSVVLLAELLLYFLFKFFFITFNYYEYTHGGDRHWLPWHTCGNQRIVKIDFILHHVGQHY